MSLKGTPSMDNSILSFASDLVGLKNRKSEPARFPGFKLGMLLTELPCSTVVWLRIWPSINGRDVKMPIIYLNPLPDDKMLDWSKLKQIADNIFKAHLK